MAKEFDPVLVEVINHELGAITEEMAIIIWRTGQSMIIKTGDFATVICDAKGRVIGQGFAAPFQLAAIDELMLHVVRKYGAEFSPGDVVLTNDPYAGMGHMPDVAIVVPVFFDGRVCAFCVSYSHHSDAGGRFPGSVSSEPKSSFEEGLRIPIVKLVENGTRNESLIEVIKANVRVSDEWLGDVEAKIAGCIRGAEQTEALIRKHGWDTYVETCEHVLDYAERSMRAAIRQTPNGTYSAEYVIRDDGFSEDGVITLVMKLTIADDEMIFDFTGSSSQVESALNTPFTMTRASVFGALKSVIGPDLPTNHGFFRPVKIIAPLGSVLNPKFPAAVGGRASVFFRIFDLVNNALAQTLPGKVAVIGEGGDILHFSSRTETEEFAVFDMFFGGWGARPTKDGVDGVAPIFMGSYGCSSIELIESHNPIIYEGFGCVPDSEGAGRQRGSTAIYREWRFLEQGEAMVRNVRLDPAPGLDGSLPGRPPRTTLTRNGKQIELPLKTHIHVGVQKGDTIYHATAGAGGFGHPFTRDPKSVLHDWQMGLISVGRARDVYGVAIDGNGTICLEETGRLRGAESPDRSMRVEAGGAT